LEWAIPRLNAGVGHWDGASCLILEKDGDITAVAVYNHWYPGTSVEISIASLPGRQWLTRPFLSAVFRTPFLEWNMRRVGSSIAATNLKSIRFCEHLGFVREGCIRQGAPDRSDLLIYGMLKSECRFLGELSVKTASTGRARPYADYRGTNGVEPIDGDCERGT
jgi:RimJ/RimL family protein N-acetyltransferase